MDPQRTRVSGAAQGPGAGPGGRFAWLRRATLSALLFAIAAGASIGAAELAFRAYERHFLVEEIALGGDGFDLEALKFNDHEGFLTARKRAGEFRILSFGDSFAGAITTPPYTYAAVIQRELDAADPDRGVRVVNLGRGGTTFPDYLDEYLFWSANVEYDAVIFNIYVGNDFEKVPRGVVHVEAGRTYRRAEERKTVRVGPGADVPHVYPLRLIDHLVARYLTWRYASEPTGAMYRPNLGLAPESRYVRAQGRTSLMYRPNRLVRYGDGLRALYELLEALSVDERVDGRVLLSVAPPHFLVSEPWMERVVAADPPGATPIDPNQAGSAVAEFVRRSGFRARVADLAPCLRAVERRGETLYYGTNSHWNVRGNEVVGHLLAEQITSSWLPGSGYAWNERPERCALEAAPPSPAVARFVGDTVAAVRGLEALEARVVKPLVGRRFPSARAAVDALVEIGMRPDSAHIAGGLLALKRQGWDRAPVALGWAHDAAAPERPVLLLFFDRGMLDSARVSRPVSRENPRGIFATRLSRRVRTKQWQELTWLVAVSSDGRFATIPVGESAPQPELPE